MEMLATTKNAFLITLTESWLGEGVLDSEVYIKDFSISRADRANREGGGVIAYVRDNLTVSHELSFSDSICELLCIYIQELKLGVITVYRPPGSENISFSNIIKKMDKWLLELSSEFNDLDILVTGDFNLGFLKD